MQSLFFILIGYSTPLNCLYSEHIFSFIATGRRGPLLCSYYLKKSVFCHLFVVCFHQKASTLRNTFFAYIYYFTACPFFLCFCIDIRTCCFSSFGNRLRALANTKSIVEISYVEFSSTL